MRRGPKREDILRIAWPVTGLALAIFIWWAGIAIGTAPGSFLRRFGPMDAFLALVRIAGNGELWGHLAISLRRVLAGLAIAGVIGVPLGYATGRVRTFAQVTGAPFQFLRMVSPLSWTPLAIVVFGVGDRPVTFLIAIGAMWPIVANTAAGVAAIDPRLQMVARSLGADGWEILTHVTWPGIRSHVLTGLRLSVGLAWVILVPAEMLGVTSGIGYFALNTRDRLAYPELMASILAIGVCGIVLDSLAQRAFRAHGRGTRRTRTAVAGTVQPGFPSGIATAEAGDAIPMAPLRAVANR